MTARREKRRHPWRRRILLFLLALIVAGGGALAVAVHVRLEQERMGVGAVEPPSDPRPLEGSESRSGAFTTTVELTTMATGSHAVSTEVAWDDDWFFEDPTVYNHELATTCSVLSALANSESAYYQAGSDSPPYMENALAKLGFEEVSTASYQYRSEIFDEIVDFLTGTDDVVAYSLATRRVTSSDRRERTLYLVSIRGSYGAEWLSDLNMGNGAEYELSATEHEGFSQAAREIVDDLAERITEDAQLNGTNDVVLLFCGHSRGAAVANIAAAYADEMSQGLRPLAPLSSIYCYTFATPEVAQNVHQDDPIYSNIFNILNPSDLVPRLPLASWGYERYGNDLWLPGYGDEGFDGAYASMCDVYEGFTGVECPYVPEDRERVDALVEDLGREIPTADDLASAGGVLSLAFSMATDVNPKQVLYGHYPSVYIAWMQSLETL